MPNENPVFSPEVEAGLHRYAEAQQAPTTRAQAVDRILADWLARYGFLSFSAADTVAVEDPKAEPEPRQDAPQHSAVCATCGTPAASSTGEDPCCSHRRMVSAGTPPTLLD